MSPAREYAEEPMLLDLRPTGYFLMHDDQTFHRGQTSGKLSTPVRIQTPTQNQLVARK
jgi:hypothetical protein